MLELLPEPQLREEAGERFDESLVNVSRLLLHEYIRLNRHREGLPPWIYYLADSPRFLQELAWFGGRAFQVPLVPFRPRPRQRDNQERAKAQLAIIGEKLAAVGHYEATRMSVQDLANRWPEGPPEMFPGNENYREFLRDCYERSLLGKDSRDDLQRALWRVWGSGLHPLSCDVFISYSHWDRACAVALTADLQALGISVAIDTWMPGTETQDDEVEQWIAERILSTTLTVFLLSERSMNSGWVRREAVWERRLLSIRPTERPSIFFLLDEVAAHRGAEWPSSLDARKFEIERGAIAAAVAERVRVAQAAEVTTPEGITSIKTFPRLQLARLSWWWTPLTVAFRCGKGALGVAVAAALCFPRVAYSIIERAFDRGSAAAGFVRPDDLRAEQSTCLDSNTLVTRSNDGKLFNTECRGPMGCSTEGCDRPVVMAGSPCLARNEGGATCSLDGLSALECKAGHWQYAACRGPKHCQYSMQRVMCDAGAAREGEACALPMGAESRKKQEEGDEFSACSEDGRSVLGCRAGRFVRTLACEGPGGCKIDGEQPICEGPVRVTHTIPRQFAGARSGSP